MLTRLVIATRGSALALWQAERVRARLREEHPGLEAVIKTVRTEGDRVQSRPIAELSATGVFTKEVDDVVLRGEAHVAVHSLKDETTALPAGLVLGMVLERGPVEDALVGRTAPSLAGLPPGARIATGSLRRRAQLLRMRPDLAMVEVRGNVETRLRRLDEGAADALVLARAGLERLGLGARITQVFATGEVLPAVSQAIVGVTCRAEDDATRRVLAAADHAVTHLAARAERAFLERIGGGCNVPAGALAEVAGALLRVRARVCGRDGSICLEESVEAPASAPEAAGRTLAEALIARGADALIRECRA